MCFEYARRQAEQENYDYAAVLFEQCVAGDPSNVTYVESFLENLKKKYGDNKRGSSLALMLGRRGREAVREALEREQWEGVIRNGLTVLALNPWAIPALRATATASEKMGAGESKTVYLRYAREASPEDPD